jgi:hypothetical protein
MGYKAVFWRFWLYMGVLERVTRFELANGNLGSQNITPTKSTPHIRVETLNTAIGGGFWMLFETAKNQS